MWSEDSGDDYGSTSIDTDASFSRANFITQRTTPNHRMYVQVDNLPPLVMAAEELSPGFQCNCSEKGVKCLHGHSSYRFFTGASQGFQPAYRMSVADTEVDALSTAH